MGISVKYDDRDTQRPGFKFAEYELKGVPSVSLLVAETWKIKPLKLPEEIPGKN